MTLNITCNICEKSKPLNEFIPQDNRSSANRCLKCVEKTKTVAYRQIQPPEQQHPEQRSTQAASFIDKKRTLERSQSTRDNEPSSKKPRIILQSTTSTTQNAPTKDEAQEIPNIEELPSLLTLSNELLAQIVSNLDKNDLQEVMCVNRNIGIKACNDNAHFSINNFITNLITELDGEKYSTQKANLREILTTSSPECTTSLQLKKYFIDQKIRLLYVLQTLDEEDINQIKPPQFLEDIVELALFKIDPASILIPDSKENFLLYISQALIKKGRFERAIKIATTFIFNKDTKDRTLTSISEGLKQTGNLQRALEMATLISNSKKRSTLLTSISGAFTIKEDFIKAIEVANLLSDNEYRSSALSAISTALAHANQFVKAIEMATSIPKEYQYSKNKAFKNISLGLIKAGNYAQAIEFAQSIDSNELKASLLLEISVSLAQAQQFSDAYVMTASISEENNYSKNQALRDISQILLRHLNGNVAQAIDVISLISDENIKSCVLNYFYERFL